jgi:hypothetical protein
MLRFPLILIPLLLSTLLNALSAIERLGAFLLQDESPTVTPDMTDPGRITLSAGSYTRPLSAQPEPVLTHKHTLTHPNTPAIPLTPPTEPLNAPPVPRKSLTLS